MSWPPPLQLVTVIFYWTFKSFLSRRSTWVAGSLSDCDSDSSLDFESVGPKLTAVTLPKAGAAAGNVPGHRVTVLDVTALLHWSCHTTDSEFITGCAPASYRCSIHRCIMAYSGRGGGGSSGSGGTVTNNSAWACHKLCSCLLSLFHRCIFRSVF